MKKPVIALLMAAGTGTRFGAAAPKQFTPLFGASVLARAARNLCENCPSLTHLFVVAHPTHAAATKDELQDLPVNVTVVEGGETRAESVWRGLCHIQQTLAPQPNTTVLVHDSARPLLDPAAVERLLVASTTHPNCTLGLKVADMLYSAEKGMIPREGVFAVQTPQAFDFDVLVQAHTTAGSTRNQFADDTTLVETHTGHTVRVVEGSVMHHKLTNPQDLTVLETLLFKTMPETRTAFGFDVHAFDRESPPQNIALCGVQVPSPHKLMGHSDADVALHAVCDALYASIGDGDIGHHFPPSDPQWKGCDSAVFLTHALQTLAAKNAVLTHIGITILGEHPRITPHRDAILHRLSTLLNLPQNRIGLTATTTEKLGFLGRGEGVAVQATATIRIGS